VLRRVAKVEARPLASAGAKRLLEELNVVALVPGDDLSELAHFALQSAAIHRVAVETRLQVFEQQREVEDLAILGRRGRRSRRSRTLPQKREGADCGRAREGATADELASVRSDARRVRRRFEVRRFGTAAERVHASPLPAAG
jgi:hypothetical protein